MFLNFIKKIVCSFGFLFCLCGSTLIIITSSLNPCIKVVLWGAITLVLAIIYVSIITIENKLTKTLLTLFSSLSTIALCLFLFFFCLSIKRGQYDRISHTYTEHIAKILTNKNKASDIYSTIHVLIDQSKAVLNLVFKPNINTALQQITVHNFKINFSNSHAFLSLFNEIFINEIYFSKIEKQSPLIIDCGSNIGMSILYFKMIYPDAKIIGFEPDEETFNILEKNMHDNNATDVKLYKKALSSKQGFISFFYDKNTPCDLGASILSQGSCEKKVESDRLSLYIDQTVDLLKMDVEGAETEIFQELDASNTLHFIEKIMLEFHAYVSKDKNNFPKLLMILEKNNFTYEIKSVEGLSYILYAYQKNE